jgi:transcription termination factor Rho
MPSKSTTSSSKSPAKRIKRELTPRTKTGPDLEDQNLDSVFGEDLTDDDEPVEKKPAKKPRRRKAEAEPAASEAAPLSADEANGSEETPRRRPSRRRKPIESEMPPEPEPAHQSEPKQLTFSNLEDWSFEEVTDDDRPVQRTFEGSEPRHRHHDSQRNNDSEGGDGSTGRRRRRRRRRNKSGGDNQGHQGQGHQGGRGHNRNQQRGQGRDQNQRRDRQQRNRAPEYVGEEVTGILEGVLELHPKGYGFLRDPEKNYTAQDSDAFVSSSVIEKYRLREGILIKGEVGPGTRGQGPRLKGIETIDGRTIEEYQEIKHFDELTAVNPHEMIKLETGPRPITMRVMDLLTPIGKGQRALIVAPPRTGKTMLLHDIAHSVSVNHPEMHVMVLLIDERPEEVTEMRRNVKGEVIASSMDRDVESHVRISQLIVERGKRIAEAGGEVFILLDSITRTARAFNKWVGNSGRTATGGLDIRALDIPKKLFGTARRFEEGGSLTVAATALIDTGSRMDEVIFQEFKGTGNMELVLSRDLADRRIWPAIDITRSGTRREEKLFDRETLDTITLLRRSLISLSPVEAMEQLTRKLEMFPSNREFLNKVRNVL